MKNLAREVVSRGLALSCTEARRYIAQGAVQVNEETVYDAITRVTKNDTIQVGKKVSKGGDA